ncbi:5-formyltetrahydrofolate cyclo-ligase [uncultured Croceitalea sp.]|uniref:5-formyltetrahydrofolate cyclo-ligase n=1 Tax=uncultured Croceitalea sp. TaxID=1798908 RepID=UPI003305F9F9
MTKKELRLKYRKKRNLLNSTLIEGQSIEITNRMLSLPLWDFSFYHIFLSILKNKEVDTNPLLTVLQGKDKNVVIPKTEKNGMLKNYLLTDSTQLQLNKLQIPEPVDGIEIGEEKIDMVFVPLLAFDQNGSRVGYGKGYYDIFLAKCRPNVVKVGLSFFEAENVIDDVSENDIPLDYCITPNETYTF